MKCLAHRAKTVYHSSHTTSELQHLQEVFTTNGYPPHIVKRCLTKAMNTTTTNTPNTKLRKWHEASQQYDVFLMYEASVRALRSHSESWMWKLCSSQEVHYAQSSRSCRRKLKGVVYKVNCNCGSTYIKTRIERWVSNSKSTRELLESTKTTIA